MSKPRLLFISSLFPDTREPFRGLDNATLLHHLRDRWEVATLALRPVLPLSRHSWEARSEDELLFPRFAPTRYLPKIGHKVNHRFMASSLRKHLQQMSGAFQIALGSWLQPDCCAVALLAEEMGFPFVAVAQGSDVHECFDAPDRRQIISEILPTAQAIITRSKEAATLLGDIGIPKEKLHPIYNGIDLELFNVGDAMASRDDLGLPVDRRIALFVGDFVPAKNPLLLLEAFSRLREDEAYKNVVLVLIGGGPLLDEMMFRAGRGNTADHVLFAGRQPAANIAKFLRAADVLCLPNEREGVPNILLEAFASGLPVVASGAGGVPEVHPGGVAGELFSGRDVEGFVAALKTVLSQPANRAAIRQHATQFTWKGAADAYHAILAKAAGLSTPGERMPK